MVGLLRSHHDHHDPCTYGQKAAVEIGCGCERVVRPQLQSQRARLTNREVPRDNAAKADSVGACYR
jgi:hypothetical protein